MRTDFRKLLEGLPQNGKAAIVELATQIGGMITGGALDADDIAQATSLIIAMCRKYGIQLPAIHSSNSPKDKLSIICEHLSKSRGSILSESYAEYSLELIDYFENGQVEGAFGFAKLDLEEKKTIHEHLASIRELVEKSPLDVRKKNKLFVKLNALAAEVDRLGTRTDAFFAFMGDIAFVSGQMAERAKPAIDNIKSVMKIIMRSRANNEGINLPAPENIPQLPNIADV